MFSGRDEDYMRQAIELAHKAEALGEVPVGALLVLDDEIVATSFNQNISRNDPTAHAEILALRLAGEHLENYRIPQAELFVTIEPCLMCAGAIIHARIKRLVFGASEPKSGVAQSHLRAFDQTFLNHQCVVEGGLLADECGALMSNFFKTRRNQGAR